MRPCGGARRMTPVSGAGKPRATPNRDRAVRDTRTVFTERRSGRVALGAATMCVDLRVGQERCAGGGAFVREPRARLLGAGDGAPAPHLTSDGPFPDLRWSRIRADGLVA